MRIFAFIAAAIVALSCQGCSKSENGGSKSNQTGPLLRASINARLRALGKSEADLAVFNQRLDALAQQHKSNPRFDDVRSQMRSNHKNTADIDDFIAIAANDGIEDIVPGGLPEGFVPEYMI